MHNAFKQAFVGSVKQALLIGTDFPDLDPSVIDQAFKGLSGHDMTLGPTEDGGYYLIGFNRHTFCDDVFNGLLLGAAANIEVATKRPN